MRSLPEKDFWDTVRTRLRSYQDESAGDDDWKAIATALKPRPSKFKRRVLPVLLAMLVVSSAAVWTLQPSTSDDATARKQRKSAGQSLDDGVLSAYVGDEVGAGGKHNPAAAGQPVAGIAKTQSNRGDGHGSVRTAERPPASPATASNGTEAGRDATIADGATTAAGTVAHGKATDADSPVAMNAADASPMKVGEAGTPVGSPAGTGQSGIAEERKRMTNPKRDVVPHSQAVAVRSLNTRRNATIPTHNHADDHDESEISGDERDGAATSAGSVVSIQPGMLSVPGTKERDTPRVQPEGSAGTGATTEGQPGSKNLSAYDLTQSAAQADNGTKPANGGRVASTRTMAIVGDGNTPKANPETTGSVNAQHALADTTVCTDATVSAGDDATSNAARIVAMLPVEEVVADSVSVKKDSARTAGVARRKEQEEKKKAWYPTLYVSLTPSLAFQKITPQRNDDIHIAGLVDQSLFSGKRAGIALETGGQITLQKGFDVYAGLLYYRQNQSIAYRYTEPSSTQISGTESMDYVFTPDGGTHEFRYAMRNLGVSAGFLYTLKDARLMHKLGAGLQYQYGLRKTLAGDTYTNSQSHYLFYQVHYRLEWAAAGRARLYVQPAFVQSFWTRESLREPLTVKPYRVGLTFGVTFAF